MLELLLKGVWIGLVGTICIDIWAAIAKHAFGLPTANWAMVGRWFGHMPRGVLLHKSISDAAPIRYELALGWIGHYLIGVLYGMAYLLVVQVALSVAPSLISALEFGLATLFAPWLIMQPSMNLSMHTLFGASLYLGWLVVS